MSAAVGFKETDTFALIPLKLRGISAAGKPQPFKMRVTDSSQERGYTLR
jgi:hypothetical protein